MLLNRESCVQETLDLGFAMLKLVFGNTLSMNAYFIHHAPRGMLEIGVVLEKVGMAEDVGCYKSVLQQVIHLHQEGIAWIGINHHLVDFAQPKIILHLLSIVGFAMCP